MLVDPNSEFQPIRFGSYELLARLAVGGMAEIFLAREFEPSTTVEEQADELFVLKRLLPHIAQHPDLVQMFIDEVRVAATLEHPNIVRVFNVGAIGNTYFQSMEYLIGVDVRQICQLHWSQMTPVPMPLVLHILGSIAEGLGHAHTKRDSSGRPINLIHRDISPHNIFVTSEGVAKILDFGVAKAANAFHQTRTGALVGKLSYMSPEQAQSRDLDHRSDIFSLGIVMWELLTSRRLLRVKELGEFEVLRRLCEEDIPPPSVFAHCPPVLDRVTTKAVARNRDLRYSHSQEFADDIRAAARELGMELTDEQAAEMLGEAFRNEFAEKLARRQELLDEPRLIEVRRDPSIFSVDPPLPAPDPPIARNNPDDSGSSDQSYSSSRRRGIAQARVVVPAVTQAGQISRQKRLQRERRRLIIIGASALGIAIFALIAMLIFF